MVQLNASTRLSNARRNSGLTRIASWNALLGIGMLFVLNELLPVVFESGENAAWDWSFIFVTLRFIVVPSASVLYLAANIALAAKEKQFPHLFSCDAPEPRQSLRHVGFGAETCLG